MVENGTASSPRGENHAASLLTSCRPFVVNNLLFIVLELGTGFCQTYQQFLACRALFGIAMGGLYGNAAATALEDCPQAARGIISGLLQQGYAFGYLLATAFARGLVNTTPHGWRPLYWFGACPPVLIIIFRLCLPETQAYQKRVAIREQQASVAGTFIAEGKVALKKHWLLLIYLVLLMAGFNFMSHGSQDLYPTVRTLISCHFALFIKIFSCLVATPGPKVDSAHAQGCEQARDSVLFFPLCSSECVPFADY